MEFVPFHSRFPDIAHRETLEFTIRASDLGVPLGVYGLVENYCIDDSCDCGKVMINVVEKALMRIVATIGYGWESVDFYTKWMFGDKEFAKKLVGAYLELGGVQSEYTQNFLEILPSRLMNKDIDTFKRHYKLFKHIK